MVLANSMYMISRETSVHTYEYIQGWPEPYICCVYITFGQVSHSCQKFCPNAEKYIQVSRTLSYIFLSTPAHSVFGGRHPGGQGGPGWKSLPKGQFFKSSSPVPGKIRGVLNNIADILVKVRGSGVKFRFWTPFDPTFGGETCQIYGKMTQSKSSQTDFCDGLHDFKTTKLRSGAF